MQALRKSMCKGFPKSKNRKQTDTNFLWTAACFFKMDIHEVWVRLYRMTGKSETYEAAVSRLKYQTMRDLESNKRIH